MRRGTLVTLVVGILVLVLLNGAESFAQKPMDNRISFTFSGPVTIPGATLPAGQYVFRIADNSHSTAQVTSADGKTSYSVFFVLRTERSDLPNDPEIHFMETPASMPRAVRAWWTTGER